MKLGPETKLLKRNKEMSKKFGIDVMTGNFDVIVIFLIYGQFEAIREANSGRMICKTNFFINGNLLKHNYKTSSTSLTHLLWVKILSIMLKYVNFLGKKLDISKFNRALGLKVVFSETTYGCVLTYPISSF